MKRWILLVLIMFIVSCAPKQFTPMEVPQMTFKPTQEYVLDMSPIDDLKPSVIKPIYVDDNLNTVDKSEATGILLDATEYNKISTILKMTKGYKDIALKEGELINIKIRTINSLQELLMLEREKTLMYKELWVNSENAYRQEKFYHTQDNIIFKSGLYVISIGTMILFGMSL